MELKNVQVVVCHEGKKYSGLADVIFHQVNIRRAFIEPEEIITKVCDYFNVPFSDIENERRKKRVFVTPRHFIHYFLKRETELSSTKIGHITQRSHATVLRSVQVIKDLIEVDAEYRKYYEDLNELLFPESIKNS